MYLYLLLLRLLESIERPCYLIVFDAAANPSAWKIVFLLALLLTHSPLTVTTHCQNFIVLFFFFVGGVVGGALIGRLVHAVWYKAQ